jgi:hypothetical protein
MIDENLKRCATNRAAELDADITFDNNTEAWDHIEIMFHNFDEGHLYTSESAALMDISITVARIQNALDWLNESGIEGEDRDG